MFIRDFHGCRGRHSRMRDWNVEETGIHSERDLSHFLTVSHCLVLIAALKVRIQEKFEKTGLQLRVLPFVVFLPFFSLLKPVPGTSLFLERDLHFH